MSPFMLLVLIVLITIAFVVFTYNQLITLRNRTEEAWSDIDVQLKRRYNLIPNLVETVKGYAQHEEGVLTRVTEARSNAINAGNIKEQEAAENMLTGALKSLFAVAESYPDLKANENFRQLQTELVDTEDKIQASRRFYNTVVRDFNTKLQVFPNSIIAKSFKFSAREFFEIDDPNEKKNVEVSFDRNNSGSSSSQPSVQPQTLATSAHTDSETRADTEMPAVPVPPHTPIPASQPTVAAVMESAKAEENKTDLADSTVSPIPSVTSPLTDTHTDTQTSTVTSPAADAGQTIPATPSESTQPGASASSDAPMPPLSPVDPVPSAQPPVSAPAGADEEKPQDLPLSTVAAVDAGQSAPTAEPESSQPQPPVSPDSIIASTSTAPASSAPASPAPEASQPITPSSATTVPPSEQPTPQSPAGTTEPPAMTSSSLNEGEKKPEETPGV